MTVEAIERAIAALSEAEEVEVTTDDASLSMPGGAVVAPGKYLRLRLEDRSQVPPSEFRWGEDLWAHRERCDPLAASAASAVADNRWRTAVNEVRGETQSVGGDFSGRVSRLEVD